jgi:shikimate dehydrogenase
LLIGAGGAAQGALPALIDAGIGHVSIYNRSTDKAQALVALSNSYQDKVASLYDNTVTHYDIIINATSLSLQGNLPDLGKHIFANKPAVYDMVYQSQATSFLRHAKEQGCDIVMDGLGMLVHQAARSFYLWFAKTPDTKGVREYLRQLS